VASTPRELTEGHFRSVLDDADAQSRAKGVKRLILCSGKVYVDLIGHEKRASATQVAVVRVEQLYPFPNVALREVLDHYPSLREVVWLQEEPSNMGAWEFMRPRLEELLGDARPLRYIGRARNSSPSEGSSAWHQVNQKALVELAFDLEADALPPSVVWSKPARSLAGATASKK
jgi:2-oxoglutarate dehydrogenase E1 component